VIHEITPDKSANEKSLSAALTHTTPAVLEILRLMPNCVSPLCLLVQADADSSTKSTVNPV
jgi:hypothetical protein